MTCVQHCTLYDVEMTPSLEKAVPIPSIWLRVHITLIFLREGPLVSAHLDLENVDGKID